MGPLRGLGLVVDLGLDIVAVGSSVPCSECEEHC